MPKRTDIKSILIIGAGPIVIGQACEFDYSGTQACKALKEEGYRIVLVNSNPATIMTDPDLADATYIEPITPEIVAKIIEKERPDALLPTMGGQTALNTALSLKKMGVLDKFNVKMIGATADAIDKAEDRELFRNAMTKIGLETPRSHQIKTLAQALEALEDIGLPAIIRPSFTLGGTGGGIAYNKDEFIDIVERGIDASPTNEVLIEESVLGWKEYEMEVVRDKKDNCIIICSTRPSRLTMSASRHARGSWSPAGRGQPTRGARSGEHRDRRRRRSAYACELADARVGGCIVTGDEQRGRFLFSRYASVAPPRPLARPPRPFEVDREDRRPS